MNEFDFLGFEMKGHVPAQSYVLPVAGVGLVA